MFVTANAETAPVHPNAAAFCCDQKYLPFALLAIHSLRQTAVSQSFDICICTVDKLELPPTFDARGIRLCQLDVGTAMDALRTSDRFSVAAYLRMFLAEAFQDQYQRIAYLDCDVMITGVGFSKIFELDLGGRPVGAVLDNMKWKYPGKPTPDQKVLGLNGPYFNSGVLLIDTAAFVAQDIRAACLSIAQQNERDAIYFDQTLLNLALQDNWAELHPAWNWQWALVGPYFEAMVDVQIVHFISPVKPWRDSKGGISVRHRRMAEAFLTAHFDTGDYDFGQVACPFERRRLIGTFLKHIGRSKQFADLINRFGPDITTVR